MSYPNHTPQPMHAWLPEGQSVIYVLATFRIDAEHQVGLADISTAFHFLLRHLPRVIRAVCGQLSQLRERKRQPSQAQGCFTFVLKLSVLVGLQMDVTVMSVIRNETTPRDYIPSLLLGGKLFSCVLLKCKILPLSHIGREVGRKASARTHTHTHTHRYTYTHTHTNTHTHREAHIYTHTHTHTHMHAHMHRRTHTCRRTSTCTHTHARAHRHMHTHTQQHIHTHTCMCVYTHTHTHTQQDT